MSSEGLIFTNDHCTGCNRCIAACTVLEANIAHFDGEKHKITIDGTKCINCGKCIESCPHEARDYIDDTDVFLKRIASGAEISLLVAPAARPNIPQLERMLGALRSMGVKAVYDTSFGADICTWAYLRKLQQTKQRGIISQPCPAVVNYIEKHDTDLIAKLAPIHSPVMCGAIYMRKYEKISGEIAFLSPCIAKRDEFKDPNTDNLIQYNITFKKLISALKMRGIDYLKYEPYKFDNDQHGLGAIYSMPGGLKTNIARYMPDEWVFQVEGQPEIKTFMDEYSRNRDTSSKQPLVVDILNCAEGCNMGTGAICSYKDGLRVGRTMHELSLAANQVQRQGFRKNKFPGWQLEKFDRELKLDDFIRRYTPKASRSIPVSSSELEKAYQMLYKDTPTQRNVDCCSCGFETCEEMANAIAKNINHPTNCVEYHKSSLEHHQIEIEDMLQQREVTSNEMALRVEEIFNAISGLSSQVSQTAERISSINDEIIAVDDIAGKLNEMVDMLQDQIGQYKNMGERIVDISMQTKLLSMNASVEAAHAKELGKGFAVVAAEMKTLSDQSANSAKEVLQSNEAIFPILDEVRSFSNVLNEQTQSITSNTKEIMDAIDNISQTELEIQQSAARIAGSGYDDSSVETEEQGFALVK